jgi:hypothetical protein
MSPHDLRGLKLIADLCILEGVLLAATSVFLLALGSLIAFIPISAGIVIFAMGYYLNNLNTTAWWIVVILNSFNLTAAFISPLVGGLIFHLPITATDLLTIIINGILSSFIVGYLLRGKVRSLFFEDTS